MEIKDEMIEAFKNMECGTSFSTEEIKKIVSDKFGRNVSSIQPSDFAYNMHNKALDGGTWGEVKLFIQLKRGLYQYVGQNYKPITIPNANNSR